ncbi:hypothetical protein LEP1GSC103_1019 [Leptospira borgpetersenii serovar Javanica str. UI 09931]|uniref:Uncharacterized protein n=2 Tax=Leptospira borgpetersenii TaxID=174 RepID=A0ABP2S972_LEPBO|nr:hypothetical protein C4Q31_06690 [Leptospira borgpetersenii serovar Ceylonica]EKP15660.1 hypothetical protein LEP1GSC128_0042 [Leptospira borgpetersenii str. 200801926]EKQ91582.1 hypothetical protein LEP1GSC101_0117 [Leptospira borgpetersenii str. UI 09149]EMN57199.1 hypothetical protein LEP1GSC090_0040 [Leptospira borgpetersenii serovar Javanica str. MK146]ENO62522.1 hypothetical protein LEP1GSC191_3843 [Leptospira borgpetersenii serovar Mini str. 201000851]EPG58498.1 hypothetical protein 
MKKSFLKKNGFNFLYPYQKRIGIGTYLNFRRSISKTNLNFKSIFKILCLVKIYDDISIEVLGKF